MASSTSHRSHRAPTRRHTSTMRPPQAGDYSFNNIGLPSFFMLSSTMPDTLRHEKNYYDVSGCGANIAWHTENDTLEIADRDNLFRDMRVYAALLLRFLNAPLHPFDFTATAAEFATTLDQYAEAAGPETKLGGGAPEPSTGAVTGRSPSSGAR